MKKLFISLLAIITSVGNVFSQSMTISGGNDHGIVICAQGYLYAWGTNQSNIGSGLLGLDPNDPDYPGDQKFYTSPQRVKMDNGLTFSQVTAGSGAFNLALSCKGIVYAWGENTQNQCGQGSGAATVITEPKPVLCGNDVPGYNLDGSPGGPYLGNVKFVAASTSAGFAILNDGRVVGWGGKNAASWCSEGQVDVPILIKFKDGSDVTNAIHIGAGDDNLLITVDPDGDGMGDLYSIGNWNGRGAVASSNANCYTAQPVMIGSDDDKTALTPLTNVRMAAAADVAGFAVTGDGLVYGWGNTWGGVNGFSKPGTTTQYAHQVVSGAYQDISGEQFLTDVKEVAGGQGYAMAVTKEGYLVYWGNSGGPGGVMPNPNYKGTDTNKEGPQFTYYSSGKIVNDAVKIARGDLFGFMVNDKDEYFAFGSNENGECGLGSTKKIINEVTPMKIPCTTQDACPEGFMVDTIWKCPGTKATLFSGFTTPKSKELSYHFTWSFNGKVLNSSTPMSSTQEMAADEFNQTEISVQDTGRYEVTIEYIGTNVPCNTCVPVTVNTYLGDKSMTIDTLITTSCVKKDAENPTATNEICFKFKSKYSIPSEFAVYSKSTGGVALDTISLTKASPIGEFCVTGDKVTFNDNAPIDTTYSIWLEDITKEKGSMLESAKPGTETYYQDYYLHLAAYEDVLLESLEMSFSSYGSVSATATPIIYGSAISESNGTLIPDLNKVIKKGKTQDLKLPADGGTATVNIDIELPGSTRGTNYFLFIQTTVTGGAPYVYDWGGGYPYKDNISGNVLVSSLGTEGINDASDKFGPYGNIIFSKLSSYDCGRMEITSKLYCPPCDDPKKLEIIASETIKDDVDAKYKKVVELCKESDDLVLDIEPLEGKNDPTAKFDIFWYDENPLGSPTAKAIKEDETGNATTLEWKTDWATVAGAADIEKAVEKVYYVMVYDHKNPESCEHYDSIKVIAHPAPVDSLDWIEFCEGSLATEPTFEIADMTINWVDEPTNVVDLTGPATGTGTKEYTYKYTVVDNKTGCESVEHTLTISVNKTGKPDVKEQISLLKDPSVKYNLSAAETNVDTDCEIHWYESETATSEMTNKSIPLDNADTIIVWAEQYNTVTKCTSERVKVEIIINDAPVPEVTNESLCLDNEIPSLAEYVKAKEHHELLWYDDPAAAKGTGSETAPSFKATAAGTYKFYVSQKDSVTNAESEKATLTITVHEVATLDLSANKTEYCINETAEELTFTANSDGDFTTANWSKKSDMSDATATLTPKTDEKGDVTYYAQAEYTNKDAQKKYASTVCYGKIQDITITTNKTEAPTSNTNFTVQYLKVEGEATGSFKTLLDQDGTAVKVDAGHSLKWYDSDKNPLASEPAPEYIANETGERKVKYYVSQVNQSTGCESELKEVTVIISSFPAPEVKAITLCQESEKLKTSFPLTAKKSTKGGFSESDYELIWYKEDPKSNPSAEEFITIDLHLEDLSYDATTETEKDFKYWVVQRYLGQGGGQSPAAELLVTIYSKPILKTKTPDPICLGGEVDLKDLYSISNRITNQQYELEYLSSNGTNPKGSIATVHGEYQCRAWFELSSGEICRSKFEDVFVTVNELEVAIEGDNTTCPGIGVELKAVLKTNNMDANDVPSYSWNVSPTGVSGQMETLNTSSEGLNKKGDKLTVDLEVSMGACKGKKPVNAHIVTVEDPGVEGTIKFDEQYNANSGKGTFTLSKDGTVVFDGCNSKVDVLFNVKQTEDKFTYENLETGEKKTGTFSNGEGKFDIKAGLYEVTYTNTCATSFKFDVKDKSLDITGSPSNWSVCEGTPLTIKIVNFKDNTPFAYDSKKHKIEWQKDGNPLPGYDTEVLYIPSTTPADNGVYSYTVTSSGCVYHDKIAMGGSFKSKPKVKINESLLAKDGIYEAVRTTAKDITIPIVQSTGIDMAALSDKIIWNEEGNEINKGEKLSLSSVDADHEYNIVIANGEKGYDPEFCGTSLDITLKVDALLSIEAILVDANGKQTKDMCLNEEGVGFKIDTTGTGTILHPDKFTFKIVETIDGVKKDIGLAKKDDYLFAEISPNKSAKYDIVYKYEVGNQDSSKVSEITVHPAYEVDWDRNVRLCEGETGFIQITKAEPASEIQLTWESDECLINGSQNGANVRAVFSESGLVAKKAMTLIASNGGICADKKYYPEFTIDKAIEGEIIAPEFVCEGHTATLDASPFKATEYVWSSLDQLGEGVTMYGPSINVVSKPGYATYTVEMKRGACTQTADATIEVRYAPRFDRIDSLSFRSVEIVLQSNTGTAPFQYIVDDNYDENINEPIKDSLEYGNHSIKIIDAAGCQIDSSFVTHAPGLEFPIHISPNGDGINDAFSIPVLRDAYPDANIRIFDRWGKKLADYKAGNAELDWDGTYNGVQMPSTDYWYEIEIKEIKKTYTGHFTLIRQ